MEWWFRTKWNLAPTDPRFLDATPEEMLTDYYAAHYDNLRKANKSEEEFEDEDFDLDAVLAEAEAAGEAEWEDIPPADDEAAS